MVYLEGILLLLGLLIVFGTYGHYGYRTGDWRGVVRFWARGMALSVAEFKAQRAGVMILVLAVVIRFVRALLLW